MCGQSGVPDLNREHMRPGLRAGPQPRSCEASVACRTSTAIVRGQCGVPDLNRDHVRPVLRAGPQPRSSELVWRAGPQPRNVSERRMSERLSEDVSKIMAWVALIISFFFSHFSFLRVVFSHKVCSRGLFSHHFLGGCLTHTGGK